MIRTLRKRFIRSAMLAVSLVVLVLIAAMMIGTFSSTRSELTGMLDLISDNRGALPFFIAGDEMETPPAIPEEELQKGRRQGGFFGNEGFSPEMEFSTRYFMIRYTEDGTVRSSDWSHIAAVDDSYTDVYLNEALDSGEGTGFIDTYIYKVTKEKDGTYLAVFLDCEREMDTIRSYMVISLIVGAGCILLVYVLLQLFSKKAVNPTIQSIVKQKQFITDASHELKTPLTVIATSQKVLEMDVGRQKWIDKTMDQVEKMRALVDEMVVLSRLDEERGDVVYDTFNASEAVTETAESFRDSAAAAGHELQLEIEPEVMFTGDQLSVRRLVSVLADNAIKYSLGDSPIRMTLSATRKGIKITSENECEPIAAEELDRLFDRFYRVDKSRSRQTGGFGVGLSIARGICETHGGSIKAECPKEGSILFTALLNSQKAR